MKEKPLSVRFLLALYQSAWRLARPALGCNRRLADGWSDRVVSAGWSPDFSGKTVWIQAASGGEAYLLTALARQLRERWKEFAVTGGKLRILASTCTRQGMDVLERYSKESGQENLDGQGDSDRVEFLPRFFPLDEPRLMRKAIEQAQPSQIVLLETELWPGLLMAAKQAEVPVLLLNGRITPKSLSGYAKLPVSFWRALAPDKILAVSKPDAARFALLFGEERVGLMSNIKFDLIRLDEEAPSEARAEGTDTARIEITDEITAETLKKQAAENKFAKPPVALFASVRRQEAAQVARCLKELKSMIPNCMAVLVPRHLHHVDIWRRQISLAGLSSRLRSELAVSSVAPISEESSPSEVLSVYSDTSSVLIWDKFGELKQLYSAATTVYVGGSLVPLGGQNFLEALASGLSPCIGPYIDNFAWAGERILEMTRQISDSSALAVVMEGDMAFPKSRSEIRAEFFNRVKVRQGGARQASDTVLACLGR